MKAWHYTTGERAPGLAGAAAGRFVVKPGWSIYPFNRWRELRLMSRAAPDNPIKPATDGIERRAPVGSASTYGGLFGGTMEKRTGNPHES